MKVVVEYRMGEEQTDPYLSDIVKCSNMICLCSPEGTFGRDIVCERESLRM